MSRRCPAIVAYLLVAGFVASIVYACLGQAPPANLVGLLSATTTTSPTTTTLPNFDKIPFVIGVWQQPASSAAKWKSRNFNTIYGHNTEGGRVTKAQWEQQVGQVIRFITVPGDDPATESRQPNRAGFCQIDETDSSNHVGLLGNTLPDLNAVYTRVRLASTLPVFANFDGHAFDNVFYDGRKHRIDINQDRPTWHFAADGGYFAQEDVPGMDYHLWTTGRPGMFDITKRLMDRLNDWSGGKPFFVYVETCTQGKNLPFTADDYEAQVWTIVNYAKLKGYKLKGIIAFTQKMFPGWGSFDMTADDVNLRITKVNAQLEAMFNPPSTSPTTTVSDPEELATIKSTVASLQNQLTDLRNQSAAASNRITELEASNKDSSLRWLRIWSAATQPVLLP